MGTITSMTGFGMGEVEEEGVRVRVELRSVNSRFCDIQVRRPSNLSDLESPVRERLQQRVARGKVTASLTWEEGTESRVLPKLDVDAAHSYVRELEELRDLFSLQGKADLSLLAGLPGLFKVETDRLDPAEVRRLVLLALDRALDQFDEMRATEGKALAKDLSARLENVDEKLKQINELAEENRSQTQNRLREKIEALLQPGEVDETRLAMEVAMICERSDITEEIVRFRSHNDQFLATLRKGGDVGRRLNFLLQEINREANTINSKASEADIVHLVVDIKEEVERLREQVQNLA